MKQNQYDAIISCINYGAPALAQDLTIAFNQVMQNNNAYITEKAKAEEAARRAKEDAERAAKEKKAHEKAAKEANLGIKKTTK